MGKSNAAPTPPDPTATAAAQTKSNIDTATAQTNLNNTDQITPTGSLKYSQIGTNADGTPHYQATTALNETSQHLFDTGQRVNQNLATLGEQQSQKLSGLLSTPFDLSNDATETRLNELASKRLDPMLAQKREQQISDLSNQGIKLGSTAYDRAVNLIDQGENDAHNSLLLSGHNQAVQEALLQRNQPINEIIGLTSGTQLQAPGLVNTPNTSVAGTDTAGLITSNYNAQLDQWKQQQANNNDLLGGLFGLGTAAIKVSDRRMKRDIVRLGSFNRMGWYSFRYLDSDTPHEGFMADEVAEVIPAAVVEMFDGTLAVNYDLAMEAA